MSLAALTVDEREVVRRTMEATFKYFDEDFHTRLGLFPDEMRVLLNAWPDVDDAPGDSNACLAINNSFNDLLYGEGISEAEAAGLTGTGRAELERIYRKWLRARGSNPNGIR